MKNPDAIYFQSKGFAEFRFLSNFHIASFSDSRFTYKSVEHFYQSQKASHLDNVLKIINANHPAEAMRIGRSIPYDKEWWERVKLKVMKEGCRMKFQQNDLLAQSLILTDPLELIEFAPWGDSFWGVDKNYEGQNHLGKILMEIRSELLGAKK